jgi:hypothetical protein
MVLAVNEKRLITALLLDLLKHLGRRKSDKMFFVVVVLLLLLEQSVPYLQLFWNFSK